jgi:hypothetical protein
MLNGPMPRELFVLHSSDPAHAGSKLHDALAAHNGHERAQSVRDLALIVVVLLSVPVWVAAARPEWMWPGPRRLALTLWLVAAIGLVLAVVSERSWQRRCLRIVTPRRETRPSS